MKNIKAIGRMLLPATHSTKVMNPHDESQELVIWDVDGEQYVTITGNTRGDMEFTRLADLYVDGFDGLLKARKAPLRVKKTDVDTRYALDELPLLEPVDIRGATSEAQIRASARYDAAHTIKVCLNLNDRTDADILARLDEVDNKQGYIKSLIRQDILAD